MNVKIQVELSASPTEVDKEEMHGAARHLTNNKESVVVYASKDKPNTIVAEFTIDKARQMDVVDTIASRFEFWVRDYHQSTISFPEVSPKAPQNRKLATQANRVSIWLSYTITPNSMVTHRQRPTCRGISRPHRPLSIAW